jgi:hypothetical protein
MPAILTNNLSVINAENFVDSFINGQSNIFMAIGRGWETGETIVTSEDMTNKWEDEMTPPVPVDSIAKQNEFRKLILGLKRVMLNDILIMVPRVNWVEGRIFRTKNETDKVGVRATDYYCINSDNEVWICVNSPTDVTQGVAVPPKFTEVSTSSKIIDPTTEGTTNEKCYIFKENGLEDSYWWRYLYTIPVEIANKKLLDTWMPVMFNKHGLYEGGTLQEEQYDFGDVNANRRLGAYRVMVSCTLSDEDTKIPYDTVYRQVGLIVDPLSVKTGDTGKQERLEGTLYDETEFDIYSGELVYLENKRAIMREQNQEETLNLILVF